MSPVSVTTTAGGSVHPNPFVGPVEHRVAIRIDVSTLTSAEVDADGYLKPGVPFQSTGALVSGAAQSIYGANVEATKIAANNAGATLAAAADVDVAVCTIGAINQDILEDCLGRALSANELAAFGAAGCRLVLY